jgi:O-antigen/teichoic acid export membrane protein
MIRPTLIYGVASMFPALLGFVLLPFYSKHLSTTEFGIIAAMGVLSSIFAVFSNLALDRAAFRFYFDSTDPTERKKVLSTFFFGSIGIATVFFALLVFSRPLLTRAYPEIDFYPFYFLTIVTISISVCEGFVMGYFRISEKPRQYLYMIFLTVCLQGGLIYYFVLIKNEGALGQIHALLFSALVLLPVYFTVAYRNFSFSFDLKLFKQGVSFSWPFIPTLLIAWVLNWSDSVFIANYSSMSEVGLYSMAYKISMVFFMLTGAFAVSYQPVFFRKANQVDQEGAKRDIYSIIHVACRGFILTAFLLALFSEDIVRLLLDSKYRDIYSLIRVILLSHILAAIMGISSNLYYLQSKRSKLQLAVVGTSALVNLLLNYLLVPSYGMYGAAWATVISMIILTVMHYHFSKTCYFINIFWLKLSFLIGISALIIIFFQHFVEGSWISLPLKIFFLFLLIGFMWKNADLRHSIREFRAQ